MISVYSCSQPIAKFVIEDQEPLHAPATIKFSNKSEKADNYLWVFGDGDSSIVQDPTHRFMNSGNYKIKLIAKKNNKMTKEEKTIRVLGPEKCLINIETPYGNMLAELSDKTPKHRDNFLKLAEEGYFDGLLFHRVINGFMIQGGDPNSKNAPAGAQLGSGGPGYQVDAEFNQDLIHKKGALAAARTGDQINPQKKSSGSQFYIVQGSKLTDSQLAQTEIRKNMKYTDEQKKAYTEIGGTPFLDMDYTVFGQVIEGLDVIDKIAKVQCDQSNRPLENVTMKISVIK